MSAFWPAAEAAQVDYEALRTRALTGESLHGMAAERFARRGLAGLIAWPCAEPLFTVTIAGATRPPWTPYTDPRGDALAAVYRFLLSPDAASAAAGQVRR